MKSDKINQRVVIWSHCEDNFKGRTGTIVQYIADSQLFDVSIDGWDTELFAESELYFQDHPLGYNQKCFQ